MNCFMCHFKALCAVKYDGGYERAKGKGEREEGRRESERETPGVEQPLMS